MGNFLALIFGKSYWRFCSPILACVLRIKGIKVGKNLYLEGIPKLKLNGASSNIMIGNNVSILGDIDLRNRENGVIDIRDDVVIEGGCRFVAARNGKIQIGSGSIVTTNAIINGGADIVIGEKCIIGPRSSINANDHLFDRAKSVREQGFMHAPVIIEDGCWIAANVVVNKGVILRKGTIIGAMSVVTMDTEPFCIYVGAPIRKIAERK